MKLKVAILLFVLCTVIGVAHAQQKVKAPTPPMGFMTWNYFADKITEQDVKTLADAMVESGLRDLGFNFIFIDDGWQGGRDHKNNMIPDPKKFPSGMKALTDYVHSKDMKIGIYSDAAPLTCAGYTASLYFEEQDAKTFANWGFDYLKYDYCGAPADWQTAIARYSKMSEALNKSGRDISFGICEWGDRAPWLWAKKAGGQLWRTTADVRDKWFSGQKNATPHELHGYGAGILDIVNINAKLHAYAGPGGWNDPDMLVVGLYGKKGPSGDLGGTGCTDVEYQSQMSLWCLMAAPLMITCDVRNMNEATKRILTNKDIIAIDQDPLGIQAERKIFNDTWQVFVKPLANGDIALGVLNTSDKTQTININLPELGIANKTVATDVWSKSNIKIKNTMKLSVAAHETKVYRISK
ncbi:MAG: glycoside hydrolase family 27 protein [Chitinophagaceae bacterium]|nr:MAG: glycoside hydrolase family 27 protein [Chitinophagaceae bacterium]